MMKKYIKNTLVDIPPKLISIIKIFLIIVLVVIISFFVSNYIIDRKLERIHEDSKPKFSDGIMIGEESFESKNGSDTALIIIHGFTSSPSRFYHLRNKLASMESVPLDIHIPLLPYHGKSLQEFSRFNHSKIRTFVKDFLEEKRKGYKKIVLVAESYGSLIMLDILNEHPHLKPEKLIFSAPALYLKANNSKNRHALKWISPFMDYCTIPLLGCYQPYVVDKYTAKHAQHAKKHGVVFINPTRELFEIDSKLRGVFDRLTIPHVVILGEDDRTVGNKEVLSVCRKNSAFCSEKVYRGGHMVHWGPDANLYEQKILSEIQSLNPIELIK